MNAAKLLSEFVTLGHVTLSRLMSSYGDAWHEPMRHLISLDLVDYVDADKRPYFRVTRYKGGLGYRSFSPFKVGALCYQRRCTRETYERDAALCRIHMDSNAFWEGDAR